MKIRKEIKNFRSSQTIKERKKSQWLQRKNQLKKYLTKRDLLVNLVLVKNLLQRNLPRNQERNLINNL